MKKFTFKSGNAVMPVLVAVLAITVAVQSYLLYRAYHRPGAETKIRVEQPAAVPSDPSARTAGAACPYSSGPVLDELWNWNVDEWDPFREMERMREQMDRLFESSLNRFRRVLKEPLGWSTVFSPQMDLSDHGNEYVVRFDLPGIDRSKVTVKLEDRVLTVQGSTSESREEKQSGRVIRTERRSGQFVRTVTLPGPVRSEGMTANYENGVLTVRIPKADRTVEQKVITL